MRRWRVPLILSAALLLAQLFRTSTLIDVVTGSAPPDVRLSYPLLHVVFAPFTLLADWLNGSGTGDLTGFVAWTALAFILWPLASGRHRNAGARRLAELEGIALLCLLVSVGLFLWWGARWSRPIPRLVASDSTLVIFDVHSHSSASHDGRPGFGIAANAAWHERAGFDAAFLTDHNVFGEVRQWQRDRTGHGPRLLNGEELSLNGLHMLVLGNDSLIRNRPWDQSFDSSLALVHAIVGAGDSTRPFVIASLPEYPRHHWGPDIGRVIAAGTQGLEIWTTSPRAMDLAPQRRREIVARARSAGVALFGATDMHGLGYSATVWNVTALPGWRALNDSALTRALVTSFRAQPDRSRVIALRRFIAPTRNARIIGFPLGIAALLRSAPLTHAVALLAWLWVVALVVDRRRGAGGSDTSS